MRQENTWQSQKQLFIHRRKEPLGDRATVPDGVLASSFSLGLIIAAKTLGDHQVHRSDQVGKLLLCSVVEVVPVRLILDVSPKLHSSQHRMEVGWELEARTHNDHPQLPERLWFARLRSCFGWDEASPTVLLGPPKVRKRIEEALCEVFALNRWLECLEQEIGIRPSHIINRRLLRRDVTVIVLVEDEFVSIVAIHGILERLPIEGFIVLFSRIFEVGSTVLDDLDGGMRESRRQDRYYVKRKLHCREETSHLRGIWCVDDGLWWVFRGLV